MDHAEGPPGLSKLLASMCPIGRTVVLGHTLNTLRHIITKITLTVFYDFVLGHIPSHPESPAARGLQVGHPWETEAVPKVLRSL